MSIEHRVHETNRALAPGKPFFVDLPRADPLAQSKNKFKFPTYQIQNRSEQWRRQTSAIEVVQRSIGVSREQGTIGRHIGISTANTVVETLGLVKVDFELGIVGVSQLGLLEVLLHGFPLVQRLREVVGEAARAAEVGGGTTQVSVHHAFGIVDGLVRVEHGASDGGHVGAVGGVLGVEDLSLGSQASVGTSVAVEGGDSVVARGE